MRLSGKIFSRPFLAFVVILVCALSLLDACSFNQASMSHFKELPSAGWSKQMPIRLVPEYADSTLNYDIKLAIRHNTSYQYGNLSLVVDLIDSTKTVHRNNVDFEISDGYGNWLGSGFGALYQLSVVIAQDIKPSDVSSIVIWQAMNNCDNVKNVTDIGIIVTPSKS